MVRNWRGTNLQHMLAHMAGEDLVLTLPAAYRHALPGVPWGRCDELFTPAYWRGQAWQHEASGTYSPGPLGRDLPEEVAACMLGGYGIPAELGIAAFNRVRRDGLMRRPPDAADLERALSMPFVLSGRSRRYRFPAAKSRALACALRGLQHIDPDLPDRALRDALVGLPGIGPKTASWIVRNWRQSDDVAIIDVHIARAGRIAGFLPNAWTPAGNYAAMEGAFLEFSAAIGVRASVLDGLMWDYMRCIGPFARDAEARSDEDQARATPTAETPTAAVPHATKRARPGKTAAAKPSPSAPSGQNPNPRLAAQRCNVASSAPASRQSRLPGFS